jgi:uncharacterized membrane protein
MAGNVQDLVREALISALQGGGGSSPNGDESGGSGGGLSGVKGLAAGAGAAALAPIALKGAGKLARGLGVESLEDLVKSPGDALSGAVSNLGDRATSSVKEKVKGQVDDAGGPGGMLKDAAKSALPFGGGDDKGGQGGTAGVGKGRRMPVQQVMDIGLPIETVYNQFTQFEEWPNFMHRVVRATQEDDCTVSFEAKIWTRTREFTADIETQRPNERIKWSVSQGLTHTGVVSFHELGPKLTRVMVGFDVDPGGLIEKFARGARHIKRAARADLHRFKAFIEMAEQETGAWRGVIEEGELVEEHDQSYDQEREYADMEELTSQSDSEKDEEEEQQDGGDEQQDGSEKPRGRARASASGSSKSRQSRGEGRRGREQKGSESSSGKPQGRRQSSSSGQSRSGGRGQRRGNSGGGSSSGSSGGRSSSRSGGRSRSSASSSSSSGRRSSGGRGSRSQGSKR